MLLVCYFSMLTYWSVFKGYTNKRTAKSLKAMKELNNCHPVWQARFGAFDTAATPSAQPQGQTIPPQARARHPSASAPHESLVKHQPKIIDMRQWHGLEIAGGTWGFHTGLERAGCGMA